MVCVLTEQVARPPASWRRNGTVCRGGQVCGVSRVRCLFPRNETHPWEETRRRRTTGKFRRSTRNGTHTHSHRSGGCGGGLVVRDGDADGQPLQRRCGSRTESRQRTSRHLLYYTYTHTTHHMHFSLLSALLLFPCCRPAHSPFSFLFLYPCFFFSLLFFFPPFVFYFARSMSGSNYLL